MKRLTITLCFGFLVLGACGQDPDGGESAHETKYNAVSVGNDICIFDQQTGLTWQGKTEIPGLHDYRNTYSWYDPDEAHKELDYRGVEDAGECGGSACDTWNYVRAVNSAAYCGFDDWRLPVKNELFSVSDLSRAGNPPTMNTDFFVHAQPAEYWSGNDYSFQWDSAWAWNFRYGHDRVDWKKTPKFVRLVRGSASILPEVKE